MTTKVPSQLVNGVNRRNYIINGAMNIAQRNTSQALTSTMTYGSLDRFMFVQETSANGTAAQVGAGGFEGFRYCMRLGRNNGGTETGLIRAHQALESIDSIALRGKTVTLSMYVLAGVNYTGGSNFHVRLATGTGTDQATNLLPGGSWTGYAESITANTAITTSFTRYSWTGTIPSNASQVGLGFYWIPLGTAGGTEDCVYVTGVQLEVGTVATDFEYRSIGEELQLCQRYYEEWSILYFNTYASNVDNFGQTASFKVTKRALPTIATITTLTYVNSSGFAVQVLAAEGVGWFITSGGVGACLAYSGLFSADAEL